MGARYLLTAPLECATELCILFCKSLCHVPKSFRLIDRLLTQCLEDLDPAVLARLCACDVFMKEGIATQTLSRMWLHSPSLLLSEIRRGRLSQQRLCESICWQPSLVDLLFLQRNQNDAYLLSLQGAIVQFLSSEAAYAPFSVYSARDAAKKATTVKSECWRNKR